MKLTLHFLRPYLMSVCRIIHLNIHTTRSSLRIARATQKGAGPGPEPRFSEAQALVNTDIRYKSLGDAHQITCLE